jgi:hypothetical protein
MEKELAARLKEWVRENGTIQMGDLIYGPTQTISYVLSPKLVTMTLLEAGLSKDEVWPLLTINKTNLEKGLRKLRRGDLLDLIFFAGKKKTSLKIEFRKTKD